MRISLFKLALKVRIHTSRYLIKEDVDVCPEYIESALDYLKAKLG